MNLRQARNFISPGGNKPVFMDVFRYDVELDRSIEVQAILDKTIEVKVRV